jgi:hypothetical protein
MLAPFLDGNPDYESQYGYVGTAQSYCWRKGVMSAQKEQENTKVESTYGSYLNKLELGQGRQDMRVF